jgi:Ni,Fe-hydrogenase III large subunit
MLILPVGPIHAGVIQPGYFAFHVAGEVVEKLPVQLGFTHRGIERLFERQRLEDGWRLAEVVAGDSAFAHSLAYCLAVESLAGVSFQPTDRLSLWRGLLLELERIVNHMADCAFIVHDMTFDKPASRLATVQERVVRLAAALTGHRLLRGVNRPGAVVFPNPGATADTLHGLETRVGALVEAFINLALRVMELPECRDRLMSTGVLTRTEAEGLGAAGLPARASGLGRDVRLRHPRGLDQDAAVVIRETFSECSGSETRDWSRQRSGRATSPALGDHAGQIGPRHMAALATGFDHAGEQGEDA